MITELFSFLFNTSSDFELNSEWSLLVFSLASGCIGLAVVTLDFLFVKATNKSSILKLSYSGYRTLFVFLIWGSGAMLGGYIGGAVGIFEITRVASVFVALSWTTVLPRLVDSIDDPNSTERVDV